MPTETRIQGMFPYRVMQHGEPLSSCSEVQFYKNTCIMLFFIYFFGYNLCEEIYDWLCMIYFLCQVCRWKYNSISWCCVYMLLVTFTMEQPFYLLAGILSLDWEVWLMPDTIRWEKNNCHKNLNVFFSPHNKAVLSVIPTTTQNTRIKNVSGYAACVSPCILTSSVCTSQNFFLLYRFFFFKHLGIFLKLVFFSSFLKKRQFNQNKSCTFSFEGALR